MLVLRVLEVLVIDTFEEPAFGRAVLVDAAHSAALERDIPLVTIPRPFALCPSLGPIPRPFALGPATALILL